MRQKLRGGQDREARGDLLQDGGQGQEEEGLRHDQGAGQGDRRREIREKCRTAEEY